MPTADLSERDSKETMLVKEEVTNDAEVFGEVVVDVEGSQRGEPSSSVLLLVSTLILYHIASKTKISMMFLLGGKV